MKTKDLLEGDLDGKWTPERVLSRLDSTRTPYLAAPGPLSWAKSRQIDLPEL